MAASSRFVAGERRRERRDQAKRLSQLLYMGAALRADGNDGGCGRLGLNLEHDGANQVPLIFLPNVQQDEFRRIRREQPRHRVSGTHGVQICRDGNLVG